MEQRQVIEIPVKKLSIFASGDNLAVHKKRVAAYARVSTEYEEQVSSYAAQIDYYTKLIHSKKEWEFVKIYTDEGISATNTKKREGFNTMIKDALDGKIDLILTKSVSRFARNTVDTLTNVRKLKEKGVEVFFEKENIYTMDSKGELLITIMSSLAQEESRSISENVTWGQRKRFADGKLMLPYKAFLGYKKGANGRPEIIPEEAKTVEYIYKRFLEGCPPSWIANELMSKGILTAKGRKKWYTTTIESILSNEKYKGDALLQKAFTVDFLTKKKKKNEGEVKQYYVHGSHPAIIRPDVFDHVQKELKRRKSLYFGHRRNFLSGKLICGECGSVYVPKTWHSTDKYRRVMWRCMKKYNGKHKCPCKPISEAVIKESFIKVFNAIIDCKDEIIAEHRKMALFLTDCSALENKVLTMKDDMEATSLLAQKLISENSKTALDQEKYQKRYNALSVKYERLEKELADTEATIAAKKEQAQKLTAFLDKLEKQESLVPEFDEELWDATMESVTIHKDGTLVYRFMGGLEKKIKI